jgi:hypothetical protein
VEDPNRNDPLTRREESQRVRERIEFPRVTHGIGVGRSAMRRVVRESIGESAQKASRSLSASYYIDADIPANSDDPAGSGARRPV